MQPFVLVPIGFIRSSLKLAAQAPKQGGEGAPEASVEVMPAFAEALHRVETGQEIILITWLHQAERDVLRVHPRDDADAPLTGVFATRSQHRPNPLGLHRVRVVAVRGTTLDVAPLEAIDGTPVVDIKAVLSQSDDR